MQYGTVHQWYTVPYTIDTRYRTAFTVPFSLAINTWCLLIAVPISTVLASCNKINKATEVLSWRKIKVSQWTHSLQVVTKKKVHTYNLRLNIHQHSMKSIAKIALYKVLLRLLILRLQSPCTMKQFEKCKSKCSFMLHKFFHLHIHRQIIGDNYLLFKSMISAIQGSSNLIC